MARWALLMATLGAGLAAAQTPTPDVLAAPSDIGAAARTVPRPSGWYGGGAAFFQSEGRSAGGLALDAGVDFFFRQVLGLRLQFTWGLTGWDRAEAMVAFGTQVGAWTTGGYRAVGTWLTTGDPGLALFKFMASIFAFVFMSLGYMVAGLAYLFAPLAATSFFQLAACATAHLPLRGADVSFEGGLGTMLAFGAVTGRGTFGFGPQVGAAVRVGHLRVGLRAMWSPAVLQTGTRAGSDSVGGALTLGYAP